MVSFDALDRLILRYVLMLLLTCLALAMCVALALALVAWRASRKSTRSAAAELTPACRRCGHPLPSSPAVLCPKCEAEHRIDQWGAENIRTVEPGEMASQRRVQRGELSVQDEE